MTLDRYFARRFATLFAGVFGGFLIITLFIGVVDQLRRFSSADAGLGEVLRLAALSTPEGLYTLLPLIAIITTITLFLGLARSSEMVVTRAAGRSALRALLAPLVAALALGALCVAVLNPLVASTTRAYEARVSVLAGERPILSLGSSGLWLRQGGAAGQTVIHATGANLDGTVLFGASFLSFDDAGAPRQRIDADRAELTPQGWQLRGAKTWPLGAEITPEALASVTPQMTIPSTLTADQIRNSFGAPSSIPIWDLPRFIDRLQAAGFSARRHAVWFQMELALPVFLAAMVLVGAAFTLRHQRGGRTGQAVLYAVLLSFGLYFLRNFAQILGENGQVPAALAAWTPPLVAIGLAMGLLLHREDG